MPAEVAQGNTKWSIVYDISAKKVYFNPKGFNTRKNICFSSFDFSCRQPSLIWDLNQHTAGNIDKLMQPYQEETNRKILDISCDESADQIRISEAARQKIWKYPASVSCQ